VRQILAGTPMITDPLGILPPHCWQATQHLDECRQFCHHCVFKFLAGPGQGCGQRCSPQSAPHPGFLAPILACLLPILAFLLPTLAFLLPTLAFVLPIPVALLPTLAFFLPMPAFLRLSCSPSRLSCSQPWLPCSPSLLSCSPFWLTRCIQPSRLPARRHRQTPFTRTLDSS